ncbi:hypothetical protein [Synechococcus sp. CS-602]|uniref:hypothetical protein n=1 Tax=Synechococcus sp. CS-602 TaxID=2847982 RepID=UPI0011AD12CC|nr:hypothetical protein [Synechococcus sp. CS-602]TWB93771.1 hypothetical protein FB106_10349 [Synechococcus sp. Ace-Pa]
MAASCFSTSSSLSRDPVRSVVAARRPVASGQQRAARRRSSQAWQRAMPAACALALLAAAVVIAPERPWVDGQICQRHQNPAACRVW